MEYKNRNINLKDIEEQTEEICLIAVKQDGLALEYVKEQTEEICLEAVRQNGCALPYVKKQTKDICLEAVRQNSYAIQYVNYKHYNRTIFWEAVKKDKSLYGMALRYANFYGYIDDEICMEAIKINVDYIQILKDRILNEELYLFVVKQNGLALEFVKEQTEEICMEAVKQNGMALEFVVIQTLAIISEALKENIESRIFIFPDRYIEK